MALNLYLPFNRSTITQGFNGNANPLYSGQGLRGHTAIDWAACGAPIKNCADGALVYSTLNRDNDDLSKYRAVCTLVEDGDTVYEIIYGHCNEIYAQVGKTYRAGEVLATAGNTGTVYSGGVKVTNDMRRQNRCAGAHLHGPQVRPCKKVKNRTKIASWYLKDGNGVYKTKDGHFLEVLDYSNGWNGCVDPEQFFNGQVVSSPPPLSTGARLTALVRRFLGYT